MVPLDLISLGLGQWWRDKRLERGETGQHQRGRHAGDLRKATDAAPTAWIPKMTSRAARMAWEICTDLW